MANFCPNCGNKIEAGSVFCENCGFRIDTQPDMQPTQESTQPYVQSPQRYNTQPEQQYSQQPYQYTQYPQPQSGMNQQYLQYNTQSPKNKTGLIIGLIVGGVVLTAAIVVAAVLLLPMLHKNGVQTASGDITSTTEWEIEAFTDNSSRESEAAITDAQTDNNTDTQTDALANITPGIQTDTFSEEPYEVLSEPETKLPYTDSLGKIEAYDFAWISDAVSGGLQGSFLDKSDFIGRWKAEFVFDGIWELVYITVDENGTVTVEPYQINYGDGWENESGSDNYSFAGSFDINRVYGKGEYGKIDIYMFIETGDMQYGVGTFDTNTGNKANVYLVRP